MSAGRHAWSDKVAYERHSDRACWYCGLIKRTRHEAIGPREFHWVEWWRSGERIESVATPPCPGAPVIDGGVSQT